MRLLPVLCFNIRFNSYLHSSSQNYFNFPTTKYLLIFWILISKHFFPRYNSFLEVTEVNDGNIDKIPDGTTFIKMNGKLCVPKRLPNGLYKFMPDTGFDRAVLDCVTSLKNGADLLWIETPDPHVGKMAKLVNAVRREVPNAKLVYNNSPSFNWTLKLRYVWLACFRRGGNQFHEKILHCFLITFNIGNKFLMSGKTWKQQKISANMIEIVWWLKFMTKLN